MAKGNDFGPNSQQLLIHKCVDKTRDRATLNAITVAARALRRRRGVLQTLRPKSLPNRYAASARCPTDETTATTHLQTAAWSRQLSQDRRLHNRQVRVARLAAIVRSGAGPPR